MNTPSASMPYNFYDILEVRPYAGAGEIKRAYRRIALKYHPDRCAGGEDAGLKFALATEIYKFLLCEEQRLEYNRILRGQRDGFVAFKSAELLRQRRKSGGGVYSRRNMNDHDYSRFIDECRDNYRKFLESGAHVKVRPKVYSERTMTGGDFPGFVKECRDGFRQFLQSVPRLKRRRGRMA